MPRIALPALTFLLALACGSRTAIVAPGEDCTEGRQLKCACPGGLLGAQRCLGDGTFGPCQCTTTATGGDRTIASGGAGYGGARAGLGGATGSKSTATAGAGSGGKLGFGGAAGSSAGSSGGIRDAGATPDAASSTSDIASGTSVLIDVFVGDLGIYVITTDAIVLYARGGKETARVASPRQITSAAFDGKRLVVADRARLTAYDPGLGAAVSADLMEACASSVLVSQGRFVCGPSNDWDRVFYTYDTASGKLLASSTKYTYNGIPMRRVPGTDDFITVTTDMSPSDFHLYTVDATTGQVVYINESPYHGDFGITSTYAFDGSPPTHLITHAGLILKIYDANCKGDANSFTTGCFVKDGALGTLSGSQYFAAMDSNPSGKVFGLVDPASDYGLDGPCAKSCLLESVDVVGRNVLTQSVVHLSASSIVAFRYDAVANAAVVGYVVGTTSYYFPSDPYPGYKVTVMPF